MKLIYLLIFFISFNIVASQSGITLKNLNNQDISIDDFIGKKVVLLNFWATWCGPCKKELPIINKLYNKYKNKNFIVISISLDESSEFSDVRSIAYGLNLKFPILLDPNSKASDYYNPSKNAPFSILYSLNGEKVKTFLGFTSSDSSELEELIINELKKKKKKSKDKTSYRLSTLDTYTQYFKNNKNIKFSNYDFLTTRTHLSAFYKKYTILASIHTNNFLTTTKAIRSMYNKNLSDYRIEKISFKGSLYKKSFVLGDFHITQGKGIALSLNKQDDLGLDTTLQGINLDLIYKKINLDLFGGFVNNTNLDISNNELYEDKRDVIIGSTLNLGVLDSLNLSFNYNMIIFKEPDFNEEYKKPDNYSSHNFQVLGGNINFNYIKNLNLYIEADYLIDNFYKKTEKKDNPHAIYASLCYSHKKIIITQEFKKYKDFQIGFQSDKDNATWTHAKDSVFYNNPATLEREGENIRDIADDIWGIRTNVRYKLSKNIKPYLNYLHSMSYHHNDRVLNHFYVGSEYYFNNLKSKIDFSLSLRKEKDNIFDNYSKSNTTDNYYGFELDSTFYVASQLSFDIKGHDHILRKSLINRNKTGEFHDYEVQATITLFKNLFISYLFNRYTVKEEVGDKYNYNAIDLKYRFLNDSYIRVFYGSIRGGIKCIGGVCKNYPEFNGLKTELRLSF